MDIFVVYYACNLECIDGIHDKQIITSQMKKERRAVTVMAMLAKANNCNVEKREHLHTILYRSQMKSTIDRC